MSSRDHHSHGEPRSMTTLFKPPLPEGQARDPVCGMAVDLATAKNTAEHAGETYYFCSSKCREKFVAEPARYLKPESSAPPPKPAPAGTIYTCPMHPQIRQVGPGNCPICGMALEPEMVTADTGPSAELIDMTRRFWIGLVLAVPVVALEMGGHLTSLHMLLSRPNPRTGFSSCSRRQSCCGPAGRFSSGRGPRSSAATSTCSR